MPGDCKWRYESRFEAVSESAVSFASGWAGVNNREWQAWFVSGVAARNYSTEASHFWGLDPFEVFESASRNAHDQRILRDLDTHVFQRPPAAPFHARYGEFEATIEIATLNILEGTLPARALNLAG
jgi:Domain of unknown function (DUF4160)